MRWATFTICSEVQKRLTGGAEAVQQSFGFSLGAGFGAEVELELGLGAGGADGELAHILHSFSTANHTIFSMPRGAGFICILYKLLAFSPEFDIIRSWIRKRFKVNNGPVPVLRLRLF